MENQKELDNTITKIPYTLERIKSILDSTELQEQAAVPEGFIKMMQMVQRVVVIKGIDLKIR